MKKIIFLCAVFMSLFSTTAFADSSKIPEKSLDRINWSVLCCGAPNRAMYVAVILLAILIVISIFYYKKISGGKKQ